MLLKSFSVDSLEVKVFDTREAMGAQAADEAAAYLEKVISKKGEANVIFAAAPSQNEFLAALAADPRVDWTKVSALHMDEYVGLPDDAPQGFGNFLRRAIFDKVPFRDVAYIGTSPRQDETIARYDAILAGRHVDAVFMGIGENGHIAFNDPHVADFNDPLRIKTVDLDERCRMQQVHDGCFDTIDAVPRMAITLTCPTLFAADRLFCMVPAATKADAVKNTVEGPISEKCPATILRKHSAATLYVDADSGKYIL